MKKQVNSTSISTSDYLPSRIPTTTNPDWLDVSDPNLPSFQYDPSVFQAHWLVEKVVESYNNNLGYDFEIVHVAADCADENATAIDASSSLQESYIAIGTRNVSPLSTYAEADVIAHELAHVIIGQFAAIGPGESDKEIIEGLCDILGIFIESKVNGGSLDYEQGEDVPTRFVRDMMNPSLCKWPSFDNTKSTVPLGLYPHGGGEMLGHVFYMLTNGVPSVSPMDENEVIQILLNAAFASPANTSPKDYSILTLNEIEQKYGLCSREYRSWSNAWHFIEYGSNFNNECDCSAPTSCPQPEKDCFCLAGTEILSDDFTITSPYLFDGNVIVPASITLTISATFSTVSFPPNAELIVEDGGTLIIQNSILDCCDENQLWKGIHLMDGAKLIVNTGLISHAENGIEVNDVLPSNLFLEDLSLFECETGVYVNNAASGFILDGANGTKHTYFNCDNAIRVHDSNGNILNADIRSQDGYGISHLRSRGAIQENIMKDCNTAMYIESTTGHTSVLNNQMGFNSNGIFVYFSENPVEIALNEIGGIHGRGEIGVYSVMSNTNIANNHFIDVNSLGVYSAYTLNTNLTATVTSNNINVTGNLGQGYTRADGIRSFMDNGTIIEQNTITGSGLKTGINCSASDNNEVRSNTVAATDYQNGIAITGGMVNTIHLNDVQNNPQNGILNTASFDNTYDDNDIAAGNQGLSIEPGSGDRQTIICNRFCAGTFDLNIESPITKQEHHQNQFRKDVAQARAPGMSTFNIQRSRFLYYPDSTSVSGCGDMVKSIGDDNDLNNGRDLDDIFHEDPNVVHRPCEDDSGSDLDDDDDPEVDCEYIEALAAAGNWAEIEKLIAAGLYIADCGTWWCEWPEVFGEMEQEIRNVNSSGSSESTIANLRATASDQLSQLYMRRGNSGFGTISRGNAGADGKTDSNDPCDSLGIGEMYHRIYATMLHQINGNALNEHDIIYLQGVAELCTYKYGDVVEWARGILAVEGHFDHFETDCSRTVEPRSRRMNNDTKIELNHSPNPADEYLRIVLEGIGITDQVRLTVIDAQGRKMMTNEYNGQANHTINTSHLAEGLYHLMINVNDGEFISNQKVVIAH